MSGLPPNWPVPERHSPSIAAVAWVAALVSGCGGGRDSHTAALPVAVGDRVLNLYNWAEYIGNQTIADFERKTHIKVVYQNL